MPGTAGTRSTRLWWFAPPLLIGVSAALLWNGPPGPAEASVERVLLVVSGDTSGWIVPCGCASNQSGGLLRRGTYVKNLATTAPVILADVGGAAGGASPYDRARFIAILRGELAMGIAAHNLGSAELALGADEIRIAQCVTGVPFLSANARDGKGELIGEEMRAVTAGGLRIALIGVVSPKFARGDLRVDEPRNTVLRVVRGLQPKPDYIVVLAYLPEEELLSFAADLPEVHAVVGGPTGQAIVPRDAGPTLVSSATNKGKFLVRLDLFARGSQRPLEGEIVEMGPDIADDPVQKKYLEEHLDALGVRDFAANETGFLAALPAQVPEGYRISETESCRACHTADHEQWTQSAHARAWETLQARRFQADSYCQQCHTTGFGLPGGFVSAARSVSRTNVGCESCHGPSQAHVANPQTRTPYDARDRCVICHDRENSPHFEYAAYWSRIKHGVSVSARPLKLPEPQSLSEERL